MQVETCLSTQGQENRAGSVVAAFGVRVPVGQREAGVGDVRPERRVAVAVGFRTPASRRPELRCGRGTQAGSGTSFSATRPSTAPPMTM
jgi:hypothetical protein